jgi:S-adenosylmethionine hydrolase
LTDFGLSDHYVGAMKGVMLGICPDAQLVDISHEITPFAITEGAYTLAQAWSCFPPGTVHLVVVDPGVGSARRPILAEAGGHVFIAPDNGVLTMALDAAGAHNIREISSARYFREPVSRTFHGRDIFAPAAAHVAAGTPVSELGEPIDDFVRLEIGSPVRTGEHEWTGLILRTDRFGNIITNFESRSFGWVSETRFELRVGAGTVQRFSRSYADGPRGEPFLIHGSAGYLEVSLNQGSASNLLSARAGGRAELRRL